jgi:hypothetical protein
MKGKDKENQAYFEGPHSLNHLHIDRSCEFAMGYIRVFVEPPGKANVWKTRPQSSSLF